MNLLDALILSVVEGVTEFLPISSTAHLLVAGDILGIPVDTAVKSFYISIQCAAIVSVLVLYFSSFFKWETMLRLLVAFIPTAIVGLVLYPIISEIFLETLSVSAGALIIGGLVMILFERWYASKHLVSPTESSTPISYRQAFSIGLFQSIAVIPGVSRAAATIIGGMAVGVDRKQIVEFSFLLAVPTMCAATALDVFKHYSEFQISDAPLFAIGFAGAFLTAIASIRWLLSYIRSHTFVSFGYYRIIIGALVLLFLS